MKKNIINFNNIYNENINWNENIIVYSKKENIYVINSGIHDITNFKGTVLYNNSNEKYKIGDVTAFNKKLFKYENILFEIKYEK